MQETGNPLFGPIGISALVYSLVMAFIIGPEIGKRTIEARHWSKICPTTIARKAEAEAGPVNQIPQFDVCMMMFGLYGDDGEQYCRMHGDFWNGPANKLLDGVNQKNRQLQEWRIDRATVDSQDRCSCASNLTLEKNRVSFAIYAGTARMVTPPSIDNLQSELKSSLSSSRCAMKG